MNLEHYSLSMLYKQRKRELERKHANARYLRDLRRTKSNRLTRLLAKLWAEISKLGREQKQELATSQHKYRLRKQN